MTTAANLAVSLLAAQARGDTRWFGLGEGQMPAAATADFVATAQGERLLDLADQSLDTVLSLHALASCQDPVARLREWRRVLREGGQLVLLSRAQPAAGEAHMAPQLLVTLLNSIGGFQITRIDEPEAGSYCLAAERQLVAGVRMPLGSIGPEVAGLARGDNAARAEFYFQFGAMLLQCQDAPLAETCFRRSLQLDARSSECLFGLGMAHGMQGGWDEAVESLQQAVALAPASEEAHRWLELARQRCADTGFALADAP